MQTLRAALVVATLFTAVACAPDAGPAGPAPRPAPPPVATVLPFVPVVPVRLPIAELPPGDEATRERLERAADGLVYTSESDYPFEYLFQPASIRGALTVARFRRAMRIHPAERVEQRSLNAFLARHIERVDPEDLAAQALIPRYEKLAATMRAALRDVRVYRVGTILIRCYLVGTDDAGNVVGLSTWAVET